jgi:phosphoglycolate phosphatase
MDLLSRVWHYCLSYPDGRAAMLIIFDLDQTLVDTIDAHDAATRRLFEEFFGVQASLKEIDFAGKSIDENFLALIGLKHIQADFNTLRNELLARYAVLFGWELSRRKDSLVLPGACRLLQVLSEAGHILALYTGDSKQIVSLVFKNSGLGHFFKICLYGTEYETRADMVTRAIERASEIFGRPLSGLETVVIGDSTRDVRAGRQAGTMTVAVGTGYHSKTELTRAGADYYFDNLEDYTIIASLVSSHRADQSHMTKANQ